MFSQGEALLEGDVARLARMLDGLRGEGAALPLVLWAIAEEIRAIGKVVTGAASGKPLSMLWRDARVFGTGLREEFRMQRTGVERLAPRESEQPVGQRRGAGRGRKRSGDIAVDLAGTALRHAAAIDRMIKGLVRGDAWDELLQLTLRFARGVTPHSDGRSPSPAARRAQAATRQNALF